MRHRFLSSIASSAQVRTSMTHQYDSTISNDARQGVEQAGNIPELEPGPQERMVSTVLLCCGIPDTLPPLHLVEGLELLVEGGGAVAVPEEGDVADLL